MPLVRALSEFVLKYPGIGLTIKNASTRDVAGFVRNDEAHFGITLDSLHDPRIRTRMVIAQPLCLILYPKHRLARARSVAIRDLQGERLILPEEGFRVRQILDQVERERGIFLHVNSDGFLHSNAVGLCARGDRYHDHSGCLCAGSPGRRSASLRCHIGSAVERFEGARGGPGRTPIARHSHPANGYDRAQCAPFEDVMNFCTFAWSGRPS